MSRKNNPINDNDEIEGTRRFKDFFLNQYQDQLRAMIKSKEKEMFHSLRFNFMELLEYDMKLADFLMTNPDRALEWADSGVFQAQEQLYNASNIKPHYKQRQLNNTIDDDPLISVKNHCKARISGQLLYSSRIRPTVTDIRSKDVSSIIQIRGTVIRQSKAKLLESSRKYECLVCNYVFLVTADIINEKDIEFPRQCANRDCKSKKFQAITDSTEAIDFQEIHLQEQIQKIGLGKIPRAIRVVLTCELSDSCQPGDDIEIIGIVRYHWGCVNNKKSDSRFDIHMYIEANSLSRTDIIGGAMNDNLHIGPNYRSTFDNFWIQHGSLTPICARNMILANLCPQLCGMYIIKLAVALTIIGGIPREEYGTRIRGQSHLLLVGDPGTGKSQLLRYAARMASRSVLTTGVGTTSAGLTVSAVKDGGEWVLEAGALVLADGGICCIDEFGSVREHDRGVIHEAMEQQTISVAKGGFVCSLNSRTCVLAAMNPPSGGFDEASDLSLNTNMATSLLSRFDVILLLLDQKNDEWDRKVGQHLMDNLCEPEFTTIDYLQDCNDDIDTQQAQYDINSNSNTPHTPMGGFDADNNHNKNHNYYIQHQPEWNSTAAFERDMARFDEMREERVHWTIDQMQAYFAVVKQKQVTFTDEAQKILTEYYALQRRKEMRDKSRTTIRLLESLIRLAQGHCRLMYRSTVLPLDAIQAVYLMEKSLCTTNSISDYSVLQTHFPRNPEVSYQSERETILKTLFPREWDRNKCDDLRDIVFDYQEDIKLRELREIEEAAEDLMMDEDDIFYNEDENGKGFQCDDSLFDGSVNSSLFAKNPLDQGKEMINVSSQSSSVSNPRGGGNGNDGFVKPVASLRDKIRNLSQSVDNNNMGGGSNGSNSVSPLNGQRGGNVGDGAMPPGFGRRGNVMSSDSPPGFGRRRRGNSLSDGSNNNGKRVLNTPVVNITSKQGELSNYKSPTYSSRSKAKLVSGSLGTSDTLDTQNNRNEGQTKSNKKRKIDEMLNEDENKGGGVNNVNKRRKLNGNDGGNNVFSQTTVNSSRLSVDGRVNNNKNNENKNEIESPPINKENKDEMNFRISPNNKINTGLTDEKENRNTQNMTQNKEESRVILSTMVDDTESMNEGISSWDNEQDNEFNFNFDFDDSNNNKKQTLNNDNSQTKKRKKKRFF